MRRRREEDAMATSTDERPTQPHDPGPQPGAPVEEPRNSIGSGDHFVTPAADPHAGYDAELNPIDDEYINTRGSER
jgi:hypothetical protein